MKRNKPTTKKNKTNKPCSESWTVHVAPGRHGPEGRQAGHGAPCEAGPLALTSSNPAGGKRAGGGKNHFPTDVCFYFYFVRFFSLCLSLQLPSVRPVQAPKWKKDKREHDWTGSGYVGRAQDCSHQFPTARIDFHIAVKWPHLHPRSSTPHRPLVWIREKQNAGASARPAVL